MKKKVTVIISALLVLVLAVFGIYAYIKNTPRSVKNPLPVPESGELTVEHAAPLFYDGLPADYVVVDVRTAEEYEKEHTEGTVNIPVALFEEAGACGRVMPLLPDTKKIIFVCPFGPRAEEMYYNLTDPKEDEGCGINAEGMYYLNAAVKFKPDRLVVR
ncbi:rhodanese-like domain-containing protein [Seleniivibrio woodruffii]|uniref:Rhodanese-like domain-containing protein n=1 Tax=Seleniivibrio woodruffii TaxID=1078050 RepID=A0A4R1K6G0_9BACT|nr:rhodanese-like domain-containing protein [Seleniivibrio woodruffii]TCK59816.1 rhodanese-like domain-containing protein [Seleniivibrio woodruffii]TVZ35963.1 rhodanese-like domain-containing protein [Seleniivibrio woodruffii]